MIIPGYPKLLTLFGHSASRSVAYVTCFPEKDKDNLLVQPWALEKSKDVAILVMKCITNTK